MKPINEIKQDVESLKISAVAKINIQREKRSVQQQIKLLPEFISNPDLLVNKKLNTNAMMKIITLNGMMLLSLT